MKWLPIAASFVFACAPSVRAAAHKHSHFHHSHHASHSTKFHHLHHKVHHAAFHEGGSSREAFRFDRPREEVASLQDVRYARQASSSGAPAAAPSHHHHHKKKPHSRGVQLPKGPTPDRISEIQSALARGGYYQGEPNGKWDDNTVAAMQKFQSANGIDATGKIDAPSLQKLGLGSDIAGVSAPRPVSTSGASSSSSSARPVVAASPSGSTNMPLKTATEASNAPAGAASAAPSSQAGPAAAPTANGDSSAGSH
jgi:Putative peptidoglycan binding domain